MASRRWWVHKTSGYVKTTVRRKHVFMHRWIIEQHFGRPIADDESVHHINRIKTDNRLENLSLMKKTAHADLHRLRPAFIPQPSSLIPSP